MYLGIFRLGKRWPKCPPMLIITPLPPKSDVYAPNYYLSPQIKPCPNVPKCPACKYMNTAVVKVADVAVADPKCRMF